MEIIISNKKLLELAEINNAQNVESFTYSRPSKFKFISLNNYDLVKSILYVDFDNSYILEKRR